MTANKRDICEREGRVLLQYVLPVLNFYAQHRTQKKSVDAAGVGGYKRGGTHPGFLPSYPDGLILLR